MRDFLDNLEKCQQYINSLEEERKKIQVFQRELPLCFELVTQAIESCKQQLCGTTTTLTTECLNGHHSECTEKTSSDGPILEEFMPLKTCYSSEDEHESESHKPVMNKSGKKSDWLRSVQLWNQSPDPPTPQQENQPKKVTVVEVKRNVTGGAFHPFRKNSNNANENDDINMNNDNNKQPISTPAGSACSSAQDADVMPSSNDGNKKEKDGQGVRKARRCWSAELHRKFVHALQQLGGSHVATPKQIREMMKVDGLTNDEVKSHLQKYRLHTRRPSSTVPNNTNSQAPQFVVVGGIWVPPPTTTAGDTTATITTPSNIYAPIATMGTPPTTMHQSSAHKPSCHSISEERAASHSDTSSSTHTTTASHSH